MTAPRTVNVSAVVYALALGCAGKQDVRFYLNGVQVERAADAPGGILVIGCDGHRLLAINDVEGTIDGADSVILPRIKVPTAAKRLEFANGNVSALGEFGEVLMTMPAAYVDGGKYPDWRAATPKPPMMPDDADPETPWPHAQPGFFNGAYLVAFSKVAVQLGGVTKKGGASPMRIRSSGPQAPAYVDFGAGVPAFGVVMPYRADGPDWHGLPAWARAIEPATPPAGHPDPTDPVAPGVEPHPA